jgi:hypothetical protein
MKKYLTALLFLFWSAQILQAQATSGTILIYGKVSRNTLPAPGIKILLDEATYKGMRLDKTICDSKKYPSQVKVFSTDSKGEYNFRGVKKGTKYKLIICDARRNKVYFSDLRTPASGNNVLRVAELRIQ